MQIKVKKCRKKAFFLHISKKITNFCSISDSACYAFPRNYIRTVVQITSLLSKNFKKLIFLLKSLCISNICSNFVPKLRECVRTGT